MKKIMKINLICLGLLTLVFLNSCNKDDEENGLLDSSLAVVTTLPNPDGQSGSSFLQLVDDLTPQKIDNSKAIPTPYESTVQFVGNDIYVFPSFTGKSKNVIIRYTKEGGTLNETGRLSVPEKSSATNVAIVNDTKGYITLAGLGKIMIFDPSAMKKTGEIDLSSLGVGDENPDPACMLIRDKILFVGLNQTVGGFFPDKNSPSVQVALIDIDTNKVTKVIEEKTSGLSMATRPIDFYSIFMDEKKDIYVVCVGAYGVFSNHKTGILKIKSGETTFDDSYRFNMTDQSIQGDANKTSWIQPVKYHKNGKLYAYLYMPAYQKDPAIPNYVTDKAAMPVEIDIYSKTIKTLPIPRSSSFGIYVNLYDDLIVFGNFNENSAGFYTYDPATGEASDKPVLETTSYPYGFYQFRK